MKLALPSFMTRFRSFSLLKVRLNLIVISGLLLFSNLSKASTFNPAAIEGIPTNGPNCYVTALMVNGLLIVPAITIDEKIASILFLNPRFCSAIETPQPGDIGLEKNMALISHVFTYLGPNRRFEKAGLAATDLFRYADIPSTSATQFVRCQSMQNWIEATINSGGVDWQQVDRELTEAEALLDVRGGAKSSANLEKLKRILDDYFQFASQYPHLLAEPEIFRLLWLSARLANVNNAYIYYNMM